jgi:hypothetical protein
VAERCVFFADVLGFGGMALAPGATRAVDALADLAHLLSSDDELISFLRSPVWVERYGLSDSIFLVADDAVAASVAAAQFFFDLAYVEHAADSPVLLRGALAKGEAFKVDPLFPETGTANLVGAAVVNAVKLESGPPRGPRLLLSQAVTSVLEASDRPASWLLDRGEGNQAELLWLLSPDPKNANGLLIGEACRTALELIEQHGEAPGYGHHYLGYLDLVTRSLDRLRERRPDEAAVALRKCGLRERAPRLESFRQLDTLLLDRLRSLAE